MPDIRLDDPIVLALREATVGDYDILAELGRGGMAMVYLAHDIALERKVAIKVMFPSLLSGEGSAERFKREARTAASLTHPGIIPIYAVRHQGSLLFFVMQFVKGRALDSILSEEGPLPVPMVQTILHQVGLALDYAHRHGVVHRDIKPGNILLDDEGRIVVTDFGIAKVVSSDSLTHTGGVVGTPSYMSPEQCTADPVTGASDQYSLGAVAYEMLTGRLPIIGDNPMQMMYLRVMQDPPPISSLRPDCPPAIESAVHRMLARDPLQRWPDLAHALAAIGAPSAREGEETRKTIAELGKTGIAHRISDEWRTPTSPVPASRFPGRPHPGSAAARTSRLRLIGGTVAAIALGGLAIWAGLRGGNDEAAPPDAGVSAVAPESLPVVPAAGSITLNPSSLVLRPGESATLVPGVTDSGGEPLDIPVSWTAGDSAVATVSDDGTVSGRREGVTTVTASAGGAIATVGVVVRAPPEPVTVARTRTTPETTPEGEPEPPVELPATSLVLNDPALSLNVGETFRLRGEFRNSRREVVTGTPLAWTSTNPEVATVTRTGTVTARAPGDARIVAAAGGLTAQAVVRVTAPEPPAEPRTPAPPTAAEDAAAIKQALTVFASAVQSRDMARLRQAYPGMTGPEEQAYGELFRSNTRFNLRMTFDSPEIEDETATITGTGLYHYYEPRDLQQSFGYSATLERSATGWLLRSITFTRLP